MKYKNQLFIGAAAFNSYFGCQKCTVRGEMSHRTMSFPRTNASKRTNDSFRKRLNKEHHHEYRTLIELLDNTDIVADFPTSDPLHLLELGVMKRCLTRWKEGTKTYKRHFKAIELSNINFLLMKIRDDMPTEIHRGVRDLTTLHFWKGSELRTFLLYVGIVVLKGQLLEEEYNHFKLLHCAVILCSSDAYEPIVNNSVLVDTLIEDYLEGYIQIYGEHTITSNIHNLCHLLDDVRRFGNLNTISTYPFENSLQVMKNRIRSGNNPLQQVARRFSEISSTSKSISFDFNVQNIVHQVELKYPLRLDITKFQTIIFKDFLISTRKKGDQWFLSKSNSLIMFKYAEKSGEKTLLYGDEIIDKIDFFTSPFDSSKINIYVSGIKRFVRTVCDWREVKCKMVCLSFETEYVFQPLLHTLR